MTVQCFIFIYKKKFLYIFPTTKCLTSRQSSFFIFFYIISYTSLWSWLYQKYLFLVPNSYFFCVILYIEYLYWIYMPCILYIRKKKLFFFPILLFYWKLYRNIKNNNLQRDDFDYKLFFDTNRIINSIDIIWNCFQIIK